MKELLSHFVGFEHKSQAELLEIPMAFHEVKPGVEVVSHSEEDIRQLMTINAVLGYELLYKKYFQVLCNHVCRFVCSREIAEDIVSEVFVKFWQKRVFENIDYSFRAYLYASVRNKAVDYLRKGHVLQECFLEKPNENQEYIDGNDPQQILLMDELFSKVVKTVGNLPRQCRRVFILSRFEGKKNKEIAMELNIKLKTVEAHMMKALAILRKNLGIYLQ